MDQTEINTAALRSSHILAVIHQRDEHHYTQTKNNKSSSESQRWLIILDVFAFSPDQSCDEEWQVNQQNKTKTVLPWLTCLCVRYGDPFSPTASQCSSHWPTFSAFSTEKLPFPQKLQSLGSCYSLHLNNTIFLSNSAIPARTQTACTPASQKQFSVLAELSEWARDKPSNTAGPASELCAQVLWKQRQKYYVKKIPTTTENS